MGRALPTHTKPSSQRAQYAKTFVATKFHEEQKNKGKCFVQQPLTGTVKSKVCSGLWPISLIENYALRQVPQRTKAFGVHPATTMFPEYESSLIGQAA